MPGLNGLQLQEALGRDEDNMPIVFITGHGDIPMSVRAMKQGAVEFLTKPVDRRDLLTAITVALRKNQEMRQQRADTADIRKCEQTLTPRERDVMERVIAGVLNKQIAAEFGIEEGTVKVHRGRVMAKMGVKSVAELVGLCAKWKAKVGEERIAPGKGAHHSPASIAGTQVPKDSTSLPEREPHPRPSAFRTSALRVPLCHQGAIAESGPIAYPPTQQQQQEA
jgi:FixJ family two-component response regulator